MRVPGGGPGCGPGGGGGPGCSGRRLVVVQSQPGRCKLKTQRWHPVKLKQIDFGALSQEAVGEYFPLISRSVVLLSNAQREKTLLLRMYHNPHIQHNKRVGKCS